MAIRTNLIDGNVINSDTHFSKYIETVSEPGVIEGMAVTSGKVGIGKCWCPCKRTNGESMYALVENFTEITITTASTTGFVIVQIGQNYIDDGSLINEDGTGVATIEVVNELPAKNYLLLAQLSNGTITDKRNMIKKVGELNMAIESLTSKIENIDERVQELEEAGAIDHLEESALVGELYTLSNNMFKQLTPTSANSTLEDCKVGNVAANTEIHIQRIAEGVESNKLKLKVKMAGSPTTNLKVEVRKGVRVNVSSTEAYWYGDSAQVLASGSLAYTSFSTNRAEVEFTLNNSIEVDKGTLLDIVVYQDNGGTKVVNADNYYILACDSTQWSEAFSFVSVNGTTRTRSKLMPYCISNSFAQSLLSKVETSSSSATTLGSKNISISTNSEGKSDSYTYTANAVYSSTYIIVSISASDNYKYSGRVSFNIKKNGVTLRSESRNDDSGSMGTSWNFTINESLKSGDVITFSINASNTWRDKYTSCSGTVKIVGGNDVNNARLLIPKEVKEIGQVGFGISYGRLKDGSWYGDFTESISTTATAGNITLGKALGYLTITNYDGTRYKIPVFGM